MRFLKVTTPNLQAHYLNPAQIIRVESLQLGTATRIYLASRETFEIACSVEQLEKKLSELDKPSLIIE